MYKIITDHGNKQAEGDTAIVVYGALIIGNRLMVLRHSTNMPEDFQLHMQDVSLVLAPGYWIAAERLSIDDD